MSFRISNNSSTSRRTTAPSLPAFTEAWYQNLTFANIVTTIPPTIASESELISWEFSSEMTERTALHLRPTDIVPSAKHTREIVARLPQASKDGQRSVVLRFKNRDKSAKNDTTTLKYNLTFFALFTPITIYSVHFLAAKELAEYLVSNPLSAYSQEQFMSSTILAPAEGFHLRFTLSRLQCLLGENYLWDEVVAAGCEMMYYRAAAADNSTVSPVLVFPTTFYQSLLYHYDAGTLNSNITRVRERLAEDLTQGFDLIVGDGTHYTHFRYDRDPGQLVMNDSSGLEPHAHILPLVRWLLTDTGLPAPTTVEIIEGPRQGFQSGSCGIACLSLVEQRLYPEAPVWSGDDSSSALRRRLLEDVISWHLCATRMKFDMTLNSFISGDDPFDLPDFNLCQLKKNHPVFNLPFKPMLRPVFKYENPYHLDSPLLSDSPPPATLTYTRHRSTSVVSISSDDLPDVKMFGAVKNEQPTSSIHNSHPHFIIPQSRPRPANPSLPDNCIIISDSDSESDTEGRPTVGTIYANLDAAKTALYAWQELKGHKWRTAQSKKSVDGGPRKKVMLRCNHYYTYVPQHDLTIDPSDHRQGRTIKTDCHARVNLNRVTNTDQYKLTYADFSHNHDRSIPEGGRATRPPTAAERMTVNQFTKAGNFNRKQIKTIVQDRFHDSKLENRQYSNLMNQSRRESAAEIDHMGGDIAAVLTHLQDENARGAGYIYHTRFNSDNVLTGVWWQSPKQQQLSRRYSDVLLNDNAANRNRYQYPLDVGIVIDNFGHSRNIWYALHRFETTTDHEWVLRHHLDSAQQCPEIFASDRHPSLIAAVSRALPQAFHIYCLHHLHDNVTNQLRSLLGSDWEAFLRNFWKVYRAVSPEAFDTLWEELLQTYPVTRNYLNAQLYPCRDRWAHCWIIAIFTAAVKTNGRCESENRSNKKIGGPKQTMLQLLLGLIERTAEQFERELIAVRDSSRRQLNHSNEILYPRPLLLIREHGGPFALQTSWNQMALGPNYNVLPIILLPGMTWPTYSNSIQSDGQLSFEWSKGEELHVINTFENENARISFTWLAELIVNRGLRIQSVYRITHRGSTSTGGHTLVVLTDGRTLCSCGMATNLGVPCRHFWAGFLEVPGLTFNIGMIRARWYQDPLLDVAAIPPVTKQHAVRQRVMNNDGSQAVSSSTLSTSNPLEPPRAKVPKQNQTISSYEAYARANAALRSLLNGVNTEDQLQHLESRIHAIVEPNSVTALQPLPTPPSISDPPILTQRGRPRTARLTASQEGTKKGGGRKRRRLESLDEADEAAAGISPNSSVPGPAEASQPPAKRPRSMHCSLCGQGGHNRLSCYDITVAKQQVEAATRRTRGAKK